MSVGGGRGAVGWVQPLRPLASCAAVARRVKLCLDSARFGGEGLLVSAPHDSARPLLPCSAEHPTCSEFAGSQPSLCTMEAGVDTDGDALLVSSPLAEVCSCGLIHLNPTELSPCGAGCSRPGAALLFAAMICFEEAAPDAVFFQLGPGR